MIAYTHRTHPRARRFKISLDQSGEVIVTTPRLIPKFIINKFVNDHVHWIEHHQARLKRHTIDRDENIVKIFDQTFILDFHTATKEWPPGVHRHGQSLIISSLIPTKTNWQKTLDRFYRSVSTTYFLKAVPPLAKKMDVQVSRIAFKTQKTRWGSCSSRGNLNFNWRLVHAPKAVIDYVIIHELAHRHHMNHSAKFWELVGKFDPKFKEHRQWLRKYGHTLTA